jgi:acyl carrier protein
MDVEDEFNVKLPDEALEKVATVRELVALLAASQDEVSA